jgi:two-component system, chemotaxis family, chemotaxis protein CheY
VIASAGRPNAGCCPVMFGSFIPLGETMGTVWVVDDDSATRSLLSEALRGAGHAVLEASDGGAALDLARRAPADLIVLDWRMSPVSGREFARAYRTMPGPHAPIIVVSAGDDVEQVAAVSHAAACLRKPFSLDELDDLVSRFVAPVSSPTAVPAEPPAPAPVPVPAPIVSPKDWPMAPSSIARSSVIAGAVSAPGGNGRLGALGTDERTRRLRWMAEEVRRLQEELRAQHRDVQTLVEMETQGRLTPRQRAHRRDISLRGHALRLQLREIQREFDNLRWGPEE